MFLIKPKVLLTWDPSIPLPGTQPRRRKDIDDVCSSFTSDSQTLDTPQEGR